jgi:acyl carrier protein
MRLSITEVQKMIRTFISDKFLFGNDASLQNDTSFLNSSILDSTGMLELIGFIEQEFGISISSDELIPENLDSINNIVNLLNRKTQ